MASVFLEVSHGTLDAALGKESQVFHAIARTRTRSLRPNRKPATTRVVPASISDGRSRHCTTQGQGTRSRPRNHQKMGGYAGEGRSRQEGNRSGRQFPARDFRRSTRLSNADSKPRKLSIGTESYCARRGNSADGRPSAPFFPRTLQLPPVAVIELKGAKTDLDRDKFNGRTAVQQCWDYLNALPDCPWGIVSNFAITRLYHRDKTPLAYQEFHLKEMAR